VLLNGTNSTTAAFAGKVRWTAAPQQRALCTRQPLRESHLSLSSSRPLTPQVTILTNVASF